MSRTYYRHREAYFPSIWPMYVMVAVIALPISLFVHSGFLAAAIAVFGGWAAAVIRIWIWKRRHPIITAAERTRRRRENARWN